MSDRRVSGTRGWGNLEVRCGIGPMGLHLLRNEITRASEFARIPLHAFKFPTSRKLKLNMYTFMMSPEFHENTYILGLPW